MAYGVYFRRKGGRAYCRAQEWVTPVGSAKWVSESGKIHRDIRCETIEQAKEVEATYIAKGLETKIKEVK